MRTSFVKKKKSGKELVAGYIYHHTRGNMTGFLSNELPLYESTQLNCVVVRDPVSRLTDAKVLDALLFRMNVIYSRHCDARQIPLVYLNPIHA